jgi:hypothetical protein
MLVAGSDESEQVEENALLSPFLSLSLSTRRQKPRVTVG